MEAYKSKERDEIDRWLSKTCVAAITARSKTETAAKKATSTFTTAVNSQLKLSTTSQTQKGQTSMEDSVLDHTTSTQVNPLSAIYEQLRELE